MKTKRYIAPKAASNSAGKLQAREQLKIAANRNLPRQERLQAAVKHVTGMHGATLKALADR